MHRPRRLTGRPARPLCPGAALLLPLLGLLALLLPAAARGASVAPATAPTCNLFAAQSSLQVEAQANYSRQDSFGWQEASVSQMANYDVIFEQEYSDAQKVRWVARSASGVGRIQGRRSNYRPETGKLTDVELAEGAPQAVHGDITLNRSTCTYEMYLTVSLSSTTTYSDGETATALGSPIDFHVLNRTAPRDDSGVMETVPVSAELPVHIVTVGSREEFYGLGLGGEGVRALASMNDREDAGKAQVSWQIVSPDAACAAGKGVVDAADPALRPYAGLVTLTLEQDADEILPDEQARIRGYLTCRGIPVKSARIFIVSGGAVPTSGFHYHKNPGRPEGYLNGMKITSTRYHIELVSDANGRIAFDFKPGKDTRSEKIGIAGEYHLSANTRIFGTIVADSLYVRARVPDLQELEQHSSYHVNHNASTTHIAENHWGRAGTLTDIRAIGRLFYEAQVEQNQWRTQHGEPAMPIVRLYVNDISLPWGGLFDIVGWDSASGRYRGAPWQPPHYTHTDGHEVDFSVLPIAEELRSRAISEEMIDITMGFARAALRTVGGTRGMWLSRQTYTLRLGSGLRTAASAELNAGPDAAVAIFPADPRQEQNPVIAPGQDIALTLVAHNMAGSAPAAAAELKAELPAGLTFVNATPAPSRFEQGSPIWALGDLPAGAGIRTVELTLKVAAGAATGTPLTVNARLSGAGDTNTANNVEPLALSVQPLGPDLWVESTLDASPLLLDQTTTFSVTVTNSGTAPAPNVGLVATLPTSVTLKGATPAPTDASGPRWTLGALAPNESRTISVSVALKPGAVSPATLADTPPLEFVFQAASGAADIFTDNNTLRVLRSPDSGASDLAVGLSLASMAASARPGDVISVRVPFMNHSSQTAPDAAVEVRLAPGLRLVDAQPAKDVVPTPTSSAAPQSSAGVVRWALGDLAPGAAGNLTLRVKVEALGAQGAQIAALALSSGHDLSMADNYHKQLLLPAPGGTGAANSVFLPLIRR